MKQLLIFITTGLIAASAMAETRAFNLSITPDFAVYDRTVTIEGLTLSLWGENQQTSVALGFVNGSVGDSAGLSWGWPLNYADNYKGIQWSTINYTKGDFFGWQSGLLNYTGRLTGLDLGLVNYADQAESGVQIGLINIIHQNESWFSDLPNSLAPGMIFINWRFK